MDIDETIVAQWRELGFWYDRTPEAGWVLRGSARGLMRFVVALRAYASEPANSAPGEHQHFGPYSYLKVTTAPTAEVNEDCVQGTPADLAHFGDLLESQVRAASIGDRFDLTPAYSTGRCLPFVVRVESEDFDPASLDPDRGRWPPRSDAEA